jgi:hypothetical protein
MRDEIRPTFESVDDRIQKYKLLPDAGGEPFLTTTLSRLMLLSIHR